MFGTSVSVFERTTSSSRWKTKSLRAPVSLSRGECVPNRFDGDGSASVRRVVTASSFKRGLRRDLEDKAESGCKFLTDLAGEDCGAGSAGGADATS